MFEVSTKMCGARFCLREPSIIACGDVPRHRNATIEDSLCGGQKKKINPVLSDEAVCIYDCVAQFLTEKGIERLTTSSY